MTMRRPEEYAEFNRDFLNAVQAGKKAGRSVDDVASGWKIAGEIHRVTRPQAARLRSNVQVIFDELK